MERNSTEYVEHVTTHLLDSACYYHCQDSEGKLKVVMDSLKVVVPYTLIFFLVLGGLKIRTTLDDFII